MKAICAIVLLFCSLAASAQYYLRGEVKSEAGKPLPNVKMVLHSTGYVYFSGSTGEFGIMSTRAVDSVTLTLDGFQSAALQLDKSSYTYLTLKPLLSAGNIQKNKLISFTKDLKLEEKINWSLAGETYSNLLENDFIKAKSFPETGFAVSIDKASYSNIRRFIKMNSVIPPDAVRIEEMLNYFNFEYEEPRADSVFGFRSFLTECPWKPGNQLLLLKASARKVDLDKVPPSNLVFLVDISGSMDMPNRLPLLKSAFRLMVNNLRDKDTVSIVVYGSTVGVWMTPTSGKDKMKILKAIEELEPGGSTAGESGISTAYAVAKSTFIPGGNNRVILATDGDFNVGQTSEEQLEAVISKHRQSGIYLTCLGVGMGNYKDSKLEILAKKGNGNFAYLDDEREAEKVLVKELTQTLYTVADDAFLTINFNAELVKEYRLIGFDNKVNAVIDSSSELEGGEVGSGHTLLAMIELTLAETSFNKKPGSIASVKLNYKRPADSISRVVNYECPSLHIPFADLDKCYRFATAVVEFGSLLKDSKYTRSLTWNNLTTLATSSCTLSDPLQKEFLEIIEKAKKVYAKVKRKRRPE